jgi:hypothetical protein
MRLAQLRCQACTSNASEYANTRAGSFSATFCKPSRSHGTANLWVLTSRTELGLTLFHWLCCALLCSCGLLAAV